MMWLDNGIYSPCPRPCVARQCPNATPWGLFCPRSQEAELVGSQWRAQMTVKESTFTRTPRERGVSRKEVAKPLQSAGVGKHCTLIDIHAFLYIFMVHTQVNRLQMQA